MGSVKGDQVHGVRLPPVHGPPVTFQPSPEPPLEEKNSQRTLLAPVPTLLKEAGIDLQVSGT